MLYFKINGLNLHFIDVGQGDCTLIKLDTNKTILVDGGEGSSDKSDKGKNVLYPYLLDRKIDTIDYMIFSHFDSDHAGGLMYILENNPKMLKIDDIYLDFIWPIKNKLISENKLNNNSLVFRLIYNNTKIMFTGDIEIPAENVIVSEYKNNKNRLKSDILKVAHHGSDTSTTKEFLELVNPKIALIGVGKNNSFNHPSKDVISRLEDVQIKIYRTDLMGEITIFINNRIGNSKLKIKNEIKF